MNAGSFASPSSTSYDSSSTPTVNPRSSPSLSPVQFCHRSRLPELPIPYPPWTSFGNSPRMLPHTPARLHPLRAHTHARECTRKGLALPRLHLPTASCTPWTRCSSSSHPCTFCTYAHNARASHHRFPRQFPHARRRFITPTVVACACPRRRLSPCSHGQARPVVR